MNFTFSNSPCFTFRKLIPLSFFAFPLLFSQPAFAQSGRAYEETLGKSTKVYSNALAGQSDALLAGIVFGRKSNPDDGDGALEAFWDIKTNRVTASLGSIQNLHFSTSWDDRCFETIQLSDQSNLLIGHLGLRKKDPFAATTSPSNLFLAKILSNGTVAWHNQHDLTGSNDFGYSLAQASATTGLALGGSFHQGLGERVITMSLFDLGAGGIMTSKMIQENGGADLFARRIIPIASGGFLVVGVLDEVGDPSFTQFDPNEELIRGQRIIAFKLNSALGLVWAKKYNPSPIPTGFGVSVEDVLEDADGTFVLTGTSTLGSYTMRIGSTGNFLNARSFSTAGNNFNFFPKSICPLPNGFLLAGFVPTTTEPIAAGCRIGSGLNATSASTNPFGIAFLDLLPSFGGSTLMSGFTRQLDLATQDELAILRPASGTGCIEISEETATPSFNLEATDLGITFTNLSPAERFQANLSTLANTTDNCQTGSLPRASAPSVSKEGTASLFPNPANAEINLEIEGETAADVNIYDVQGKLMLHKTLETGFHQISIADLENGIYLIQMTSESGISTHRLVIQH